MGIVSRRPSEALEWARRCDGKFRHTTEHEAAEHAKRLNRQHRRTNAGAYFCQFCRAGTSGTSGPSSSIR